MNEAQQTATLETMTDKELKTLVKRLDAQVSDLTNSIAAYEQFITVAGAQAAIDGMTAVYAERGIDEKVFGGKSAVEVAEQHRSYYAKTYRIHQAKLITKTRRLAQAAGEMARRLGVVNV
jgi:hypothetical protein